MSAVSNSPASTPCRAILIPRSLSELSEVLLDPRRRSIFQGSNEAITACVVELTPKIAASVQVHASLRVHVEGESLESFCRELLPGLLRKQYASGVEPLAEIIVSLSDQYTSSVRGAEQRFLSILRKCQGTQRDQELDETAAMESAVLDEAEQHEEASDADHQPAEVEHGVLELDQKQRQELRELEREIRLQEYVNETIRALFDELEQHDRMIAELYYLQGFDAEEIAAILGSSPQLVQQSTVALRDYWLERHTCDQLTSPANTIRRDIDRTDLRLNETHGVTLLANLLTSFPNLRRSAELLNLVADSHEFFESFLSSKRPEICLYREQVLPKTGVDWNVLGRETKNLLKELVTVPYPQPEEVRYDPTVARFLGVQNKTTQRGEFAELDAQFLAACIRRGFYSGRVHHDSPLAVRYGSKDSGRHVRNPLTRGEVVEPALAQMNALTLLRRTFPNLDSIKVSTPGYFIAVSMLGLPSNAPVSTVRHRFVEAGVLSGTLPSDYTPTMATSAYFDARCVPRDLEANRDEMIRRRWANIDDPENDSYMSVALGVRDTVEALTHRAAKTLGKVIPDNHPFKYNERLDSRYFDLTYVSAEEREFNLCKAFRDTFGTLTNLTFETAVSRAGIPRLARILNLNRESFTLIKATVKARGYLE